MLPCCDFLQLRFVYKKWRMKFTQSSRLCKGAQPLEDVSWFGTVRLFGCKVAMCCFVRKNMFWHWSFQGLAHYWVAGKIKRVFMSVRADGCWGGLRFKVLLLPEDAVLSSEIGPQFLTGQSGKALFWLGIAMMRYTVYALTLHVHACNC